MARRIKSLFTFGLLNREELLYLSKRDKLMAKKKFYRRSDWLGNSGGDLF